MSEGTSNMNRRQFLKGASFIGAGILLGGGVAGCSSGSTSSTQTASGELNLSDWDSVLEAAKGQEVSWWMHGGRTEMNDWADNTAAALLKDKYGITLKRTGVSDTKEIVTQISSEIQSGTTEGSVDFLWVNGENFNSLKKNNYLYGPFAEQVPAAKYYDPKARDNAYDAGIEIAGLEMTWHRYCSGYFADTAKTGEQLPSTAQEYLEWIKQFPGHTSYPEPGDEQGTRYVFNMVANIIGRDEWSKIATDTSLTKDQIKEIMAPGLSFLRDLNPYLWNEGKTFPSDQTVYNQMYADGEAYTHFSTTWPVAKVSDGSYPSTTKCFMLKDAMLCYGSYLAIPSNAKNLAAALVAVNEFVSPELELSKYKATASPSGILESTLTDAEKKEFDDVDLGSASLNPFDVQQVGISLATGNSIEVIEEIWHEEVLGKYN